MTSHHYDALEREALAELLRWGLAVLGDGWGDGFPVDAAVSEFLASPGMRQEPWPAFGLELHLPTTGERPQRTDLCLLQWHEPHRNDVPRQWRQQPAGEPGLTYAADFVYAEYDVVEGALLPMGRFHRVAGGEADVWPEGPLRDLHRCCGHPRVIGLTPGRGAGVSAVLFEIRGDAAWSQAPALLEHALSIPGLGRRVAALEKLCTGGAKIRAGVSTLPDGRLLPRGGLEISGISPTEETAEALMAAGASRHAVDRWLGICRKLPYSERVDRALPEVPALDFPWQMRAIHASYVKLGLQHGEAPLKLYLRIDGLPHGETIVTRRLMAGGLPESDVRALATSRADARRGADGPDDDAQWWETARQGLPDAALSLPFAAVLWPLLRGQWNRIVNELGPRIMRRTATPACDDLLIAGLKRMVTELGPGLDDAWRGGASRAGDRLLADIGIIGGVTAAEKNAELAWCRAQLRGGLASWLAVQPAAAARLVSLAGGWADATRTMLRRIDHDWSELVRVFGLEPEARLVAALPDLGDRHGGGNAVQGLVFERGGETCRLLYKPRGLRAERCWEDLWQRFAADLPDPPPAPPVLLDLGTHGYMAWVDASSPATPGEARRYCKTAGRMLALLYVLGAGDVHAGNIVSRPEGPVIVDAELVFDGNHGPWTDAPETGATPLWQDSVLSTGMLPSRLRGVSGAWVDLVVPDVLRDSAALEAGFREMCGVAAARPELLRQAIAGFSAGPRRVLLRSTTVYATLLAALRAPEAMASATAAQGCLSPLRNGKTAATAAGRALIAAEETSLLRGDVPLFMLDGEDIFSAGSLQAPITQWASGLQGKSRAEKRLERLSVEVSQQAGLIAMAGAGLGRWPRSPCPEDTRDDHLPATVARWVRDCLVREAQRRPDGGRPMWLTWRWEPSLAIQTVGEMPSGLYAGHFGALAFLNAWCRSHPQDREAAALLLQSPLNAQEPIVPAGMGFDGLSGSLRLARLLGQPLGLHATAITRMHSLDMPAQPADFVTGCAGLLSALSWYSEAASDPAATALAQRLAERCVAAAVEAAPGLAHGRCGPAVALIAASRRWAHDGWLRQGTELLGEIAAQYDAAADGWPDGRLHHQQPMQGWCRGSAGIALAHLRALTLAPAHSDAPQWRTVIELAAGAMIRSSPGTMAATPLCCGSIGIAVSLEILGAALNRPDWLVEGRTRLAAGLRSWSRHARQLPLGLMDGMSGLGLAALWPGEDATQFLPLLT